MQGAGGAKGKLTEAQAAELDEILAREGPVGADCLEAAELTHHQMMRALVHGISSNKADATSERPGRPSVHACQSWAGSARPLRKAVSRGLSRAQLRRRCHVWLLAAGQ